MRHYFRSRAEIFGLAAAIGGSVDVVWFVYRSTETWTYFDVPVFHKVVLYLCIAVAFLPTLVAYLLLYGINRLLIVSGQQGDLRKRQIEICTNLIRSYIDGGSAEKIERDLVDELAWVKLKPFWRYR